MNEKVFTVFYLMMLVPSKWLLRTTTEKKTILLCFESLIL